MTDHPDIAGDTRDLTGPLIAQHAAIEQLQVAWAAAWGWR